MKKSVLGIMSSDWHLHKDNIEDIKDIARQLIKLSVKNKTDKCFILGDIFESRNAQPLDVIDAFDEIISMFYKVGITLYLFPGNHDKVDYSSIKSYLDNYRYHPGINVVRDTKSFVFDNLSITMIPFFEEVVFETYFDKVKLPQKKTNILMLHQSINGVKNNGGLVVEDKFSPSKFDQFENVFIGHYHNRQSINNNVHYIGSVMPKNFGEDNEKGFTLLFTDGSFEYVASNFKRFENVIIDLDETSIEDIKTLTEHFTESDDNIKFNIKGDKSKLDALDINNIKQSGIKIAKEANEISEEIFKAENDEFIEFNKELIIAEFPDFVEKYEIQGDIELGIEILLEQLS